MLMVSALLWCIQEIPDTNRHLSYYKAFQKDLTLRDYFVCTSDNFIVRKACK
jgi:hypothetical protein